MSYSKPRVGVGVFVFKNNKFLMGKRLNAHGEGTWSVPGGHLEFGESFSETAKREVKEETGLEIKNVTYLATTNDIFHDDEKHYITIWMTADWESGAPKITEPDKYISQQWCDFNNLPMPLFLPWEQLKTTEPYANLTRSCDKDHRD